MCFGHIYFVYSRIVKTIILYIFVYAHGIVSALRVHIFSLIRLIHFILYCRLHPLMSLVYDCPWFKLFISAQYIIVKFIQSHVICSQLNINVNIFLFIGTQLACNADVLYCIRPIIRCYVAHCWFPTYRTVRLDSSFVAAWLVAILMSRCISYP